VSRAFVVFGSASLLVLSACATSPDAAGTTTPTPSAPAAPSASTLPVATATPTAVPTPDPAAFTAVDPAEFYLTDIPAAWGGWDYEDVNFVSPSGNLGCAILNHGVDTWGCKIEVQNWEFPRSSPDDFCYDTQVRCGNGIEAEGTDLPHPYQHGDPGFPATLAMTDNSGGWVRVLQYGEMVTFNGVTCFSEESGVTCANATSGHGFVISRDENTIF